MRYPVMNLGQLRPAPRAPRAPACPAVAADDPKLNCALTRDGGVLCSDGKYYPPGCPSPKITSEAQYQPSGGALAPVVPQEFSLDQEVGTGFPWLAVGIAAAGGVIAVIFG